MALIFIIIVDPHHLLKLKGKCPSYFLLRVIHLLVDRLCHVSSCLFEPADKIENIVDGLSACQTGTCPIHVAQIIFVELAGPITVNVVVYGSRFCCCHRLLVKMRALGPSLQVAEDSLAASLILLLDRLLLLHFCQIIK